MEDFNLIYSYTKAQAITDGVLVDISQEAQALGFRFTLRLQEPFTISISNVLIT